jgi:hypothetical protein
MARRNRRSQNSAWPLAMLVAILALGVTGIAVFAATRQSPGATSTANPSGSELAAVSASATLPPTATPPEATANAQPTQTEVETPAGSAHSGIWSGLRDSGKAVAVGDVTLIFDWPGGLLARGVSNPPTWYSSDAKTWTKVDQTAVFGNEAGLVDAMAWNGSLMIAAGEITSALAPTPTVWSSTDGKTWRAVDTGGSYDPGQKLVGLAANPAGFVGATEAGVVWTSTDGQKWSSGTLPGGTDVRVQQVVATSTAFAIVGLNGGDGAQIPNKGVTIWSSIDGKTWNAKVMSTTDWAWENLFVLDDGFVAYEGADSMPSPDNLAERAWQSSDGREWTSIGTPPAGFYVVGSNGSRLVAQQQMLVAGAPIVLDQSPDAVNWASLPISGDIAQLGHVAAVGPGGVFITKSPVDALEYFAAVS